MERCFNLLDGILESLKESAIFALDRNYNYLTFNENHKKIIKNIWGVDIKLGENILGHTKYKEDREKAKKNFDRALNGESFTLVEQYGDEFINRRWYKNEYNPLYDESGNIIGLTVFLSDITEDIKTTHQLHERIKELECLNLIGEIAANEKYSLEEILDQASEIIPHYWQYPEIACARIIFYGQEFISKNFSETKWKLSSNIILEENTIGKIEVYYLEKRPEHYEGPFLMEEKNLINSIAKILSNTARRKYYEDLLKKSEEKFRTYIEKAPIGVSFVDKEGNFLEVNEEIYRESKYSKEELQGLSIKDIFASETFSAGMAHFNELLEKGRAEEILKVRRKDGTSLWVHSLAVRINENLYIAFTSDITQLKETEKELRHKDRALKSSIHAVARANLKGEVTFINQAFLDLWEYEDEKEVLGKNILEFWEDRDKAKEVKNISFSKGKWIGEMKAKKKNGELIDLHLSTAVVYNEENEAEALVASFVDITERKQAEETLNYRLQSEQLVSEISKTFINLYPEEIDQGINHALNLTGEFFNVDRSYVFQFSKDKQEMSGTHEWCKEDIEPQKDRTQNMLVENFPWWWQQISNHEFVHIPDVDKLPPGAESEKAEFQKQDIKSMLCVPLRSTDRLIGFIGFESVKEKKNWRQETTFFLQTFADILVNAFEKYLFDPGTQLPNKENLYNRIGELIKSKDTEVLSLMLINIENYIEVINNIGHDNYNNFLRTIGLEIENRVSLKGEVYKVYDNKFALLVKNINKKELRHFAENFSEKLQEPWEFNNIPIYLDTQVGVAVYPEDAHDKNTLFQNAYLAMHKAKEKKQPFTFYNKSFNEDANNNIFLLGETKSALENNDFVLHYQPKITLKDGSVNGAEALIRWNHPEKGMIPPGEFIPLIEQTALINNLTYWVLEKVALDILEMLKEGIDVKIAVNITSRNLFEENFPEKIKSLLTSYGVSPERIELEVTERDIMQDFTLAQKVLGTLADMGFKITLDDFGTGYSSLTYLKNLPIDDIKIDQSFVRDITDAPKDKEIVSTTVKLGKVLDKQTVAEGVESKEALNLLEELGGDYAQGYFISKPKPYQDFVKWYKDR